MPPEGEHSLGYILRELSEVRGLELPDEDRRHIQDVLKGLEENLRSLTHMFTLVVNTCRNRYSRFLFLGDIDKSVLDIIKIPGKRYYSLLKASHHGTQFGSALCNMSTEFLLVSRNQREYPRIGPIDSGYISNVGYRMILSTEFLGHCHIG
jgi:hypothetical protein